MIKILFIQALFLLISCTPSFAGPHALGGLGQALLFISIIYLLVAALLLATIVFAFKRKIQTRRHLIFTMVVLEISLLTPGYFPWFFIYMAQFVESCRFESDAFWWFFLQLLISIIVQLVIYKFVIKKYLLVENTHNKSTTLSN